MVYNNLSKYGGYYYAHLEQTDVDILLNDIRGNNRALYSVTINEELSSDDIKVIFQALKTNEHVSSLTIINNGLNRETVLILYELLNCNSNITNLWLESNNFEWGVDETIFTAVCEARHIKWLNYVDNDINSSSCFYGLVNVIISGFLEKITLSRLYDLKYEDKVPNEKILTYFHRICEQYGVKCN